MIIFAKTGSGQTYAGKTRKRVPFSCSGGTWILPRLIGWAKATELILTGETLTGKTTNAPSIFSALLYYKN